MKRLVYLVVLALATIILAGCAGEDANTTTPSTDGSGATTTPQAEGGGTLIVADSLMPPTMDPHGPVTEERIQYLFVEGLTASTSDGEIVPALAESWEVSADGLEYSFDLRDGVTFHNGDPLTADDVKWSLERVMDPATEGRRQADMANNIASIEVVDEGNINITLQAAFAPFLGALTDTFIVSPESEIDESGAMTGPIGTGPFQLEEFVPDQSVLVTKFDSYWEEGVPTVDAIEVQNIPDEAARVSALLAGDVHAIYGYPASQLEAAESDSNLEITFNSAARWWGFSFNLDSLAPPFDDPRVRRAIALGLDKSAIVELVTFGAGQVTNDFYPEGQFWNLGLPDPYAEPDVEAAMALLEEAGATGATVRMIGTSAGGWDRSLTVLEEQLRGIGLNPVLEVSDWPTYEEALNEGTDWDMSMMIIDYKLDPSRNFAFFDPNEAEARFLGAGWQNEEFLALIEEARLTSDPEARKSLYTDAYQMMLDEVPTILYANDTQIWGNRTELTGFQPGLGKYHAPDAGFARASLTG